MGLNSRSNSERQFMVQTKILIVEDEIIIAEDLRDDWNGWVI